MGLLTRQACARGLARLLPATLFGRLALLLALAVLASHVLALTLLFEALPALLPHPEGLRLAGMPPDLGPPPPPPRWGMLMDIGVRLSALLLAAWIGARWLSRPMSQLAEAARDLGNNLDRPPLQAQGPLECRETTRVFNEMQARIRQQMADRDRFVASVSHDLRTPLTRLRLRAESLADPSQRQAFQRDVREMDAMVQSTLDYLRAGADTEPRALLDLTALVDTLVQDHQACGHRVTFSGTARPVAAQVSALRRSLENLVENALRYGQRAHVRLIDTPASVCVEVVDAGPGLPEGELQKVLAPFYRVEGSRNRAHGGVGLGLSIAHDIARRHGGSLQLRNRPPGQGTGLVASLELPRSTGLL